MRKSILFALLIFNFCTASLLNAETKDPQQKTSSILSLQEVVQSTLKQNPEIKAMQKDAEASKAKISQAGSWEDPMVGVRLYQVPFSGGPSDAMDIDYILSQKIPFPGKKKAASQIVYHEYLHHLENLNAAARTLLKEAKQSYYSLFSLHKQIEQSQQLERILKSMIEAAQSKLATAEGSTLEALQGQSDLTKLLIERETLLERKKILEAKLKQLMARSSEEKMILPSKLELPKWNITIAELNTLAQNSHSSVKLAEHTIGEKNWAVKAAKREYYPDFSAQLEYVQRPGATENAWTGELLMNVPLLFNKKSKAVQQAEAELASAQYSKTAAKNNVLYKVQEAYSKMQAAEQILKLNQKTLLPQSKQAIEVSSLIYSTGKISFLSYLATTRSYLEAQLGFWKSYETLALTLFDLEEAAGVTQEEWANLKKGVLP